MSYLRVKWIKGHPYLYEQASYREGKKVRTKHIRYVGKIAYSGSGSGGSSCVGIASPTGVGAERKAYVDKEINHLKLGDTFPFERDVLRQYMYHQDYRLRFNSRNLIAEGYVKQPIHDYADLYEIDRLGLRSDSSAFTWLHEMGHSLEFTDKLVDDEIEKLRQDFINQVHKECRAARAQSPVSSIAKLESFIQKYGRFFDIRTIDSPETETGQQWISEVLSKVKSAIETNSRFRKILYVPMFSMTFFSWTMTAYRLDPSEIFADTVASLILDPKKAFDAHGPEGRKYVTRVWVKLVKHFEDKYQLSLQRPKTSKQKTAR